MGGSGGSWQCMLQTAAGASLLCFPLICVAFQNQEPREGIPDAAVAEKPESAKPPAPVVTLPAGDAASDPLTVTTLEAVPDKLPKVRNNAIAAALADGVSTKLALAAGGLEANPVAGSFPMGLAALTGVKVLLVLYADKLPEKDKRFAIKTSSSVWGGAAINNLMVMMAAPPPIPIVAGIVMGIIAWKHTARGYDESDRLAALQATQLPSAPVQASLEPAPALAP
jgi:hypothetical protein